MPDSLKNFQFNTANWRKTLRRNQSRSKIVIAIFIFIYLLLGVLIDLFWRGEMFPRAPLSLIFHALITFQLVPWATIITVGIAVGSLWVTYAMHDRLILLGTEYKEITPETAASPEEKQFYNIVEEMKVAAGLNYMPKVFIIDADYMNAFASGYSEKSAMVAITRGLLAKLDRDEIQAVMAHEISHIRHMDIKLTLMASVLSNLLLMVIDILFWGVIFGGRNRRSQEGGGGGWLFIAIIVLRYLLPLVTVLLMLFLSRSREYMADAGCVELTRQNEPLARALLKIQGDHEANQEAFAQAYHATPHEAVRREAYIFDPIRAGIENKTALSDFFSTHPSIQKRLQALGFKKT